MSYKVFAHFWLGCLYILDIRSLLIKSFVNIFSHSTDCLFVFFMVSFAVQKLLSLIRSHLFIFAFISFALRAPVPCLKCGLVFLYMIFHYHFLASSFTVALFWSVSNHTALHIPRSETFACCHSHGHYPGWLEVSGCGFQTPALGTLGHEGGLKRNRDCEPVTASLAHMSTAGPESRQKWLHSKWTLPNATD